MDLETHKHDLIEALRNQLDQHVFTLLEQLQDHGCLYDSSLEGANLSRINLQGVQLTGAKLSRTNLSFANLEDTHLEGAELYIAELIETTLQRAHLYGANLSHAYLPHAKLQEAALIGAELEGARFFFANLQDADLQNANLKGTRLNESNMQGVRNLHTAQLDQETVLPNNLWWTPQTDLTRFTDPNHPNFYRSSNRLSPAYKTPYG